MPAYQLMRVSMQPFMNEYQTNKSKFSMEEKNVP